MDKGLRGGRIFYMSAELAVAQCFQTKKHGAILRDDATFFTAT